MAISTGRNTGVTGIIDAMINNDSTAVISYAVVISGFDWETGFKVVDRSGRGVRPKLRLSDQQAGGSWIGKPQPGSPPMPVGARWATGTLTLTQNVAASMSAANGSANAFSFPISIPKIKMKLGNNKTDDLWDASGQWLLNGTTSTMLWNGSQVTFTAPTANDQETDQGLSKLYDPNNLVDITTQRIDCQGIADTDAAEFVKLASYTAGAIVPGGTYSQLKFHSVRWVNRDLEGGQLLVSWRHRDSKDEYVMPPTYTVLDPQSLNSHAGVAQINTTSSTLTGFALRTVKSDTIWENGTNSKTLNTSEYGLRTTPQDRTFPGTFASVDTYGLFTTGSVVSISNSSAPAFSLPSSFTGNATALKMQRATVVQLTSSLGTNNQYETRWNLGLRSTFDQIVLPLVGSVRAVNDPWVDDRADIYNSTADTGYLANQLVASYQATIDPNGGGYFTNVRVKAHVDGKKIATFRYTNYGILVEGETHYGSNLLECRMSGTNPQFYVLSNIAYGTATVGTSSYYRRLVVITRQRMNSRIIRNFTVSRIFQGTTFPDSTIATPGQINSGTFLGLSAGNVRYAGAKEKANIGLSTNGSFNMYVGFQFTFDSSGIIDNVPQNIFNRNLTLTLPTNATNTGWTNAVTLGFTDVAQPSSTSFSGFVT